MWIPKSGKVSQLIRQSIELVMRFDERRTPMGRSLVAVSFRRCPRRHGRMRFSALRCQTSRDRAQAFLAPLLHCPCPLDRAHSEIEVGVRSPTHAGKFASRWSANMASALSKDTERLGWLPFGRERDFRTPSPGRQDVGCVGNRLRLKLLQGLRAQ
jgi:hypothetical protein